MMHISDLPTPPHRLPFIGDLWRINTRRPVHSELDISRQLGSRLFQLQLGRGRNLVVATDHKAISSVSKEENWARFISNPFLVMREEMTGRGLLTASNSDPYWSEAHSLLSPGFSQEALRNYHPGMINSIGEMCDRWTGFGNKWVDIPSEMNRLTLDVISKATFSDPFGDDGASGTPPEDFSEILTSTLRQISSAGNSAPGLSHFRVGRLRPDAARLRRATEQMIAAHDACPHVQTDLLDRMCPDGIPQEGTDARRLIIDQCLTFLAAGNETTAGTLAFCLHYLSQDQDLQDSVREESMTLSEQPGYEQVARLRLTRRVVDEALRLWPVAPAYFRRARNDTVIESVDHGAVSAPKNTVVMVLLLGAQRDTSTWGDDAEEFRPSRFESQSLRSHPDRVYRPFGVGPRSCIGRQFALHEAVLTLSIICSQFKVLPSPNYSLSVEEMITLKPHGLQLKMENL